MHNNNSVIGKRVISNMAIWNVGFFPQIQLGPLVRILSITGKGSSVLKGDCSRWSLACLQIFCYTWRNKKCVCKVWDQFNHFYFKKWRMKFQTFRNFSCHFSLSDKKIRPKKKVWNLIISLTSHNTSAASICSLWLEMKSPITTVLLLNYFYRCISEKL
jgi:hypothetical protein